MFKRLVQKLIKKLYSIPDMDDKVDLYLTNAGIPGEPLFPIIERQRNLHLWKWADSAPEKGVPDSVRQTSIFETCQLCGALSMRKGETEHNYKTFPNHRYLIGWNKISEPNPICPTTCQETIELMKHSLLTLAERQYVYKCFHNSWIDLPRSMW